MELKPADGLPNGAVATLQGTATPAGDKFFVESVGVMQPVVITLIAQTKGDAIKIVLGKQRWDENLKEATTGADGQVTLKLRTQGEVRMTVSSVDTKKYWLVVWAGAEVLPTLEPAISTGGGGVGSAASSPGGGGGSSATNAVIAIALVAITILLLVIVVRRRRPK